MADRREKVDALIIGFGKGGKTLAPYLAAQGLKVIVVEKSPLMYGGTCINVGCIPTKALAHDAHLLSQRVGLSMEARSEAYAQAVRDKNALVSLLRAKNFDNVNGRPGATVLTGAASFLNPREVRVETEDGEWIVEADRIFINTGARAVLPNLPGIEGSRIYTSTELLEVERLPARLAIVGGGYIGLEFASIYAGFGSEVTVIERGTRFMPREDPDIADEVRKTLEKKGIRFLLNAGVNRIEDGSDASILHVSCPEGESELAADAILIAAGRTANTEGLNLDAAGVARSERGFIQVDERLRTNVPHIWALGDVNGGPQFTYISLDDYRIVRDALFGDGGRSTKDRHYVPYTVFIDPPLSQVGMTETEALRAGHRVKTAALPASASPRARQLRQTEGLMKAVVDADNGRLLGVTLFAAESGEVVNIVSMFMKTGEPYATLRDSIFTHPSMAESLNDLLSAIG
ncbi:FAD-dependent oxidoreductase [Cohnella rhizosphaerae]|uniref:FAD-dependent oxidoreductase n=1 Tax=Cohnella rhizosphaerae TaxID=1457232 RepID=A0A9X4QTR4_9BACL|nr:FAD-dependent oxidoreductase [Cohnella rhizosphaerae]MDG0810704.1 FAD-dependent oxidoreductase [Cohnella rhizosphaerae]